MEEERTTNLGMEYHNKKVDLFLNEKQAEEAHKLLKFDFGEKASIMFAIILAVTQLVLFIHTLEFTHLAFVIFVLVYLFDFVSLKMGTKWRTAILHTIVNIMTDENIESSNIKITSIEEE